MTSTATLAQTAIITAPPTARLPSSDSRSLRRIRNAAITHRPHQSKWRFSTSRRADREDRSSFLLPYAIVSGANGSPMRSQKVGASESGDSPAFRALQLLQAARLAVQVDACNGGRDHRHIWTIEELIEA